MERMCAYDPELVDAIHNTVNEWESARISGDALLFWRSGSLYRIPLRLTNSAPLLERVCPAWIRMQNVSSSQQ